MSLILFFLLLVFCFSSFWWLCFVFCFHVCLYCALCFWFCCFSFLHFLIVWPKNPDQITEYLKCSFWCSVLVPASWQFHLAQLRTPTRTRDENGICFIFMVLNNVPKYLFLQWFLNINQNFPQSKWALKKMITFHNVQNQNWCFRNGPLGRKKKERDESVCVCDKEKWKKPRRTKGRHWEMNPNNPFAGRKTMLL